MLTDELLIKTKGLLHHFDHFQLFSVEILRKLFLYPAIDGSLESWKERLTYSLKEAQMKLIGGLSWLQVIK